MLQEVNRVTPVGVLCVFFPERIDDMCCFLQGVLAQRAVAEKLVREAYVELVWQQQRLRSWRHTVRCDGSSSSSSSGCSSTSNNGAHVAGGSWW
jgi:hypothetical protein